MKVRTVCVAAVGARRFFSVAEEAASCRADYFCYGADHFCYDWTIFVTGWTIFDQLSVKKCSEDARIRFTALGL